MQLTPIKFLSQIALLLKLLCCSLIAQTKAIECTVIKTVTGDELILETAGAQQFTVFLNNIDAPEIGQEYCETSKSMVHRFVMDKKLSVTRIAHSESGHVVDIKVAGVDLSWWCVRNGLAWVAKDVKSPTLNEAQEVARAARRGIWSDNRAIPPWVYLDAVNRPDRKDPKNSGAYGTGFFISTDGYIVTNYHVVKNSKKITCSIATKSYEAKVVKYDEKIDLALLKIDAVSTPLEIANYISPVGSSVYTLGFPQPETQGFNSKFTDGTVSSLSGLGDKDSNIQISVPVQPGNSGGPLVNNKGHIAGVIVSKLATPDAQNVNYAIKGSFLLNFLKDTPKLQINLAKNSELESLKTENIAEKLSASTLLIITSYN